MVPSPAAPILAMTEPVPTVVTSKTSTTTGSKESTAKKSTASKRESLPHRKKSPTKMPVKCNGSRQSKMTSKSTTSGHDASNQGSAAASASDDTKSKIAKKAVREQVPEKEKVVPQVNEPSVGIEKSSDKPTSTTTTSIEDPKLEGVKQTGEITTEDGGNKGEQQQ